MVLVFFFLSFLLVTKRKQINNSVGKWVAIFLVLNSILSWLVTENIPQFYGFSGTLDNCSLNFTERGWQPELERRFSNVEWTTPLCLLQWELLIISCVRMSQHVLHIKIYIETTGKKAWLSLMLKKATAKMYCFTHMEPLHKHQVYYW